MNHTIIPKRFSHRLLRKVLSRTVGSPDIHAYESSPNTGRERPRTQRYPKWFVNFSGWLLVAIAPWLACSSALAVDPLPAARKLGGVGWTGRVGVPGGIPNRTTIFQTIPAAASTSTIQTAINSCPSGQVVLLSPGTYSLSQLTINRSNITLRGSVDGNGLPTTVINASGTGVQIGECCSTWYPQWESPVSGNHRSWTGGYAQGTTTITVSSTTGMTVGSLIILDQLNDADITAYSPVNPDGPYVTGEYTSVLHPQQGYDRVQHQVNRIAAIPDSTHVTLSEPVYMPNWDSSLTPEAWFFTGAAASPITGVGVENLKIVAGSGGTGIKIYNTYGCWAKNNDISIGTTAHIGSIFMWFSVRPEVRHNYLHDTGVADRYGIHTRQVAGALVEDNIFNSHGTMLMVNGVSGSVYAYNYDVGYDGSSVNSYMTAGILTHGGSPNMILFEGNWAPEIQLDTQWQNSAYMVGFRNRLTALPSNSPAPTGNRQAIAVMEMHHHASFIGNVLGTTGVTSGYEDGPTTTCHDATVGGQGGRVWYIGTRSGGCGGGGTNYDPLSLSTLVRAVNWDNVTNGIVGGGFTISDLPNSYYLTSKPAFFGTLAWPAFNPSSPNLGATAIPAGYRFVNGNDPPAGTPPPTPTATATATGTPIPTPTPVGTPTPTATPSSTPTPNPTATPPLGLSFESTQGVITSPFVVTGNTISQSVLTTDPTQGGRAAYTFNVSTAGDYLLSANVNCPDGGSNSFFVNIDAEPTTAMEWNIPVTSGFEIRVCSWPSTTPQAWTLSAGTHQLIIRGREPNAILGHINLGIAPNAPTGLHVVP